RFIASLHSLKIKCAEQVAIDQLQRGARLASLQSTDFVAQNLIEPFAPVFCAFGYPYAPPAVVLKHRVVMCEHDGLEKCLEREQPPACVVFDADEIKDVSMNEELRD